MMTTEEWRVIPGLEHYAASSAGRIRREATIAGGFGSRRPAGHILTPRPVRTGHLKVTISVANKPSDQLVHRLVALTFLPPAPPGKDWVCHKDDDPANNRPGNLYWGDRRDNVNDMMRLGGQCKGERVAGAKLSPAVIAAIRSEVAAGRRQRDVARAFGTCQANVSLICSGKTWGHVE